MAIRLNAIELLANILSSSYIKTGTVITSKDLLRFQSKYDYIIPGHIFYETSDKDIDDAIGKFKDYYYMDKEGNIHVTSRLPSSIRDKYNSLLPGLIMTTLPSFANNFVIKKENNHCEEI